MQREAKVSSVFHPWLTIFSFLSYRGRLWNSTISLSR